MLCIVKIQTKQRHSKVSNNPFFYLLRYKPNNGILKCTILLYIIPNGGILRYLLFLRMLAYIPNSGILKYLNFLSITCFNKFQIVAFRSSCYFFLLLFQIHSKQWYFKISHFHLCYLLRYIPNSGILKCLILLYITCEDIF